MSSSPTSGGSGDGDDGRPPLRLTGEVFEMFTGVSCRLIGLPPERGVAAAEPMRSMSSSSV